MGVYIDIVLANIDVALANNWVFYIDVILAYTWDVGVYIDVVLAKTCGRG